MAWTVFVGNNDQTIRTKVNMMVPIDVMPRYVDVTAAMDERSAGKRLSLNVINEDPFAEIEV